MAKYKGQILYFDDLQTAMPSQFQVSEIFPMLDKNFPGSINFLYVD